MRLSLHPRAIAEIDEARTWYASRSLHAGDAFMAEIDHAMEAILDAPTRWPEYLRGTRRYLLKHFPYMVIYETLDDEIVVFAVAHGRRKPGYWISRQRRQ